MRKNFEATLVELEDRAREARNRRSRRNGLQNQDAAELADIVTQLIQTLREASHV